MTATAAGPCSPTSSQAPSGPRPRMVGLRSPPSSTTGAPRRNCCESWGFRTPMRTRHTPDDWNWASLTPRTGTHARFSTLPPFPRDIPSRSSIRRQQPRQTLAPWSDLPPLPITLVAHHSMMIAINGSPAEAELAALIRDVIVLDNPPDAPRIACLPELGGNIGSLKGIVKRCRLVVTNDTGPRHLAAAFARPCVTLFGPTDPRWTTLPDSGSIGGRPSREVILVADPTLPPEEVADDHPRPLPDRPDRNRSSDRRRGCGAGRE